MVRSDNSLQGRSGPAVNRAMYLAAIGGCFTFVVILVGVWTRLVDAGLGCPDWPGCYGALVVPDAQRAAGFAPDLPLDPFKAWMEMFHRYIASGLGLVALTLAWMAWKNRHIQDYPVAVSWVLLGIICLQGAFGAWTVTLQLWPQVVTLHLLGGFTVLACFFWLHFRLKACRQSDRRPIRLPGLWWLVGFLLVAQVALGGWTSSNYAGIACTGFPTCNNEWWPDYIDLMKVSFDARGGSQLSLWPVACRCPHGNSLYSPPGSAGAGIGADPLDVTLQTSHGGSSLVAGSSGYLSAAGVIGHYSGIECLASIGGFVAYRRCRTAYATAVTQWLVAREARIGITGVFLQEGGSCVIQN